MLAASADGVQWFVSAAGSAVAAQVQQVRGDQAVVIGAGLRAQRGIHRRPM
ncbi:hypothetical protein D9M71_823920 [compost metagenome]